MLNRIAFLATALLIAGCAKSPTAPLVRPDPTVLIKSQLGPQDTVRMTWWDKSNQSVTFTVPTFTNFCAHFTATLPGDSVRYEIDAFGDGGWSKQWSPWFNPLIGPIFGVNTQFYTVTIISAAPSATPLIYLVPDSIAPC